MTCWEVMYLKTISVLLTNHPDFISAILYYFAGHAYTHVSLGLEDNTRFYSFNLRGFCVETAEKHQRRKVKKSVSYQLAVSDAVYDDLQARIREFEQHREDYQYARVGLIFALLQIPFYREKHYICSQFVAELLTNSGAMRLPRKSSVYLPNQFRRELERAPSLACITYNPMQCT